MIQVKYVQKVMCLLCAKPVCISFSLTFKIMIIVISCLKGIQTVFNGVKIVHVQVFDMFTGVHIDVVSMFYLVFPIRNVFGFFC